MPDAQDLRPDGADTSPAVSVIVPALNEEERIARTLDSVFANGASEAIVVDGGSKDQTVELANGKGATVLVASGGRGAQQNAGAAIATDDLLVRHNRLALIPARGLTTATTLAWPRRGHWSPSGNSDRV